MDRNGKHVLVAYIMKPKAGYDYLATAAHFAAESSTGTNVNVCTTDDFTKSVDALVYYIDPDNEEMKVAYPNLLFDRNIIDGRGMMCSFLTLAIGNNQGNLFADNSSMFMKCSHSVHTERRTGDIPPILLVPQLPGLFAPQAWATWSTARSTTSTCLQPS